MNPNFQRDRFEKVPSEFTDKVVEVKRVSKKTRGGNQVTFTALVVSGDKKSRVGVGLGKAKSVADAIQKGIQKARKTMITVVLKDGTVTGSIKLKYKGAEVLIRPGKSGGGLIAGGPVRSVVELAGIKDLASKMVGSRNKSINVWTTLKALQLLSLKHGNSI